MADRQIKKLSCLGDFQKKKKHKKSDINKQLKLII